MSAPGVRAARLDRLSRALSWSCSPPDVRDLGVALALSLPVPLIMAFTTEVRVNYAYHDVFIPLDAAWRTLQGQWPHSDFYTPLGLSYFWLHGAAAWLWGMDGLVLIRANFVALPFVLVPALVLAWRRLDRVAAILLIVALSVLVTSPAFIDGPATVLVHLANYNRIGGGLAALVCLWTLGVPRAASGVWSAVEALLIGIVLVILLYLKLTFFLLAAAIIVIGCLTNPGAWRPVLLAALVAGAGVLALEWLHPGLLAGYLRDIGRAGAANHALIRPQYAIDAVFANLEPEFLLITLAGVALWLAPWRRRAVAGMVIVAVGCLLVSTQSYGGFSPALVVLVMLLASHVRTNAPPASPAARALLDSTAIFAVLLAVLPFALLQSAGAVAHIVLARSEGISVDGGRTEPLRDLLWYKLWFTAADMPAEFTADEALKWRAGLPAKTVSLIVADGFDLLRHEALPARRIASLSFSNPFPTGLRAPSPRGVALWWDADRTFAADQITAEMVVGDAEVVMVPKLWWDYDGVRELTHAARELLARDFVARDSRFWTAWVKR